MLSPKRLDDLSKNELEKLLKRSEIDIAQVMTSVQEIIKDIQKNGDAALLKYAEEFDGIKLTKEELVVSKNEISSAYDAVDKETISALEKATENIEKFQHQLLPQSISMKIMDGVIAGQLTRPFKKIGAYIPGGRAFYPSTVLMTIIPARVAGVPEIVACTPPTGNGEINPLTLVAADIAGVDALYRVGGAQAIAAMAYGTETIPTAEKIVGPGNIYVVAAKRLVSSDVSVDFAAGPSEILILADESANPDFIAVDMLSQTEHDPDSAAVLITPSKNLASSVAERIKEELTRSPRHKIIEEALRKNGAILVADLEQALDFVNKYAPEHLEIMTVNPEKLVEKIQNAGSIFLGDYSPVSAGDYAVGPSHVLPTGGYARFFSGLSVDYFLKKPTFQKLSKSGLKKLREIIIELAEIEGLPGHVEAVRRRFEGEK